ncbi:MAG: XRE family transcriptional regulator [Oscillospiraceae bacterium]|jgi:transcriptional regulator with XRE-family HTH domain|nr:XRE family transcriptional regulator [Oscillospiraceae bacterium]
MSRNLITEKSVKLGERIKQLRQQKGLTQGQLGEIVGVQRAAIGKYEKGGIVNPPLVAIKALAAFFGVSTDYLLGKVPTFGERLRQAREKAGLTLAEVAERADITPGDLIRLETGARARATDAEAIALGAIYSVPVSAWNDFSEQVSAPENTVTDDDIRFALFDGAGDITDEMYEEVKSFAAYVKDRERKRSNTARH